MDRSNLGEEYDSKCVRLKDGRRLSYADFGDPAGRPIIYCHGGLSSRFDVAWAHERCKLAGVRLLAIDRPGIGSSDRKPGRTLLDWAADVREFVEQLGLKNIPVLGWSLGGPYAMVCGYVLSDRVSCVGTIGGMGIVTPDTIDHLGMAEDRILFKYGRTPLAPLLAFGFGVMGWLPPAMVRSSILSHLCPADEQTVKALSMKDSTQFFYESLRQGGAGAVDDYNALAMDWGFRLEDVTKPVFVWRGSQDNMCTAPIADGCASALPNAQLIVVPDDGHFLLHNQFAQVMETLLSASL